MADLEVHETAIPGLLVVRLPVHADARGWFKENWHRARMTALGLPDFGPVQHSVAHNGPAGVTRGIHAEPWDKLVSVVHGRAFGAWVDLRDGPTFGAVHTQELDEHVAVFVPRGVGNAYQTLVADVVYSYLVNDHWSPDGSYTMLNLADETVAVDWPIPLARGEVSAKDQGHPRLAEVTPVPGRATLVLGSRGRLGRELVRVLPGAQGVDRDQLDLADPASVAAFDYAGVGTVVNAAAWTAVDAAETRQGRRDAWAVNATGVAGLARAALQHGFTLVHYSTDHVFDGTQESSTEGDPLAPLNTYGASKAAGDLVVSVVPRHYLLRTAWVVGDGPNFVRAMVDRADRGLGARVVDDQRGRLTFAADLAAATRHLLAVGAPHGTYDVTCDGEPASWAELARTVFVHRGRSAQDVTGVSTQDYAADRGAGPTAPRPARSVLELDKLRATGFQPADQADRLTAYLGAPNPRGPRT